MEIAWATPWGGRPASAVDGGSKQPRSWPVLKRAIRIAGLLLLCMFALTATVLTVEAIQDRVDRYWLDRHGVLSTATVKDTLVLGADSNSSGGWLYLLVHYDDCYPCEAWVRVATNSHPVGSKIEVRYDPRDSEHAIVVDDPPGFDPSGPILLALTLYVAGVWIRTLLIQRAWGRKAAHLGWTYREEPALAHPLPRPQSIGGEDSRRGT